MRLWSIHPVYLDAKGLVALWREALLAQHVLAGLTRGYKNHPQLIRFKNTSNPQGAIASYLKAVALEATQRGYKFDTNKIVRRHFNATIPVTNGQVAYEFAHLLGKLQERDPARYLELKDKQRLRLHPLFTRTRGPIADWEVVP